MPSPLQWIALQHEDGPPSDGPPRGPMPGLDRELPPGTMVGEYCSGERLGAGTFGVVYRAHHPIIGKAAAVKVLAPEYSARADTVLRFLAEARAVNTIQHPNIVDIFNFGTLADGRLYYVMELLEGGTLAAWIAAEGRIAPASLVRLLRDVASALDAAHRKGIIHRDLKPENVFLARVGADAGRGEVVAKLLDFGVAKLTAGSSLLASQQTRTGTPIGTPHYMSPEQCIGLEVDYRSDIYALGVLCFEALTGQLPFDGQSVLELMNQHTLAERPLVSSRVPTLGAGVDLAIRRMMDIDPLKRPASAGAALNLLAQSVGLAPGMAAEPGSSPRPSISLPMAEELGQASTVRARASQPTLLGTARSQPGSRASGEPGPASRRRRALGVAVAIVVALGAVGLWLGRTLSSGEASTDERSLATGGEASTDERGLATGGAASAAVPSAAVPSAAVPSAAASGAAEPAATASLTWQPSTEPPASSASVPSPASTPARSAPATVVTTTGKAPPNGPPRTAPSVTTNPDPWGTM